MIKNKICSKCGKEKSIREFGKEKLGKDGLRSECKECISINNKNYRRSLEGKIKLLYTAQRHHSKARGHNPPTYSLEEFRCYCRNSDKFMNLFYIWEESNYEKSKSPSIDRIDDDKGYSMDNIQVMTWEENASKARNERGAKYAKKISKYSLDGELIETYNSTKEASRLTGINRSSIIRCCNGVYKTAGGFIWRRVV